MCIFNIIFWFALELNDFYVKSKISGNACFDKRTNLISITIVVHFILYYS